MSGRASLLAGANLLELAPTHVDEGEAIVNGESLGDVFDQVKKRFLADLIEMELRAAESALFGGGGGGGGGGLLGSLFGILGGGGGASAELGSAGASLGSLVDPNPERNASQAMHEILSGMFGGGRAGGGPVAPGSFYAVNERSTAPGIFYPLAPGIIEPPSAEYASPGGGAAEGGRSIVELWLRDELLDSRIRNVSGPVAVEVTRQAAPAFVDAAAAETTRRLGRRRI